MAPVPVSLAPDPVIEACKRDIDRTLLRENPKLTPEQRLLRLQDFVRFTTEIREAGHGREVARKISTRCRGWGLSDEVTLSAATTCTRAVRRYVT